MYAFEHRAGDKRGIPMYLRWQMRYGCRSRVYEHAAIPQRSRGDLARPRATTDDQVTLEADDLHDDWATGEMREAAPGSVPESETLNRIMLKVASRDRAAFSALYRATAPKLYGVCLRMLRDPGTAEEVLQELYSTVWQRADSFDPSRANALTWLSTIARNRAIDRLRERQPRAGDTSLDDDEYESLTDDDPSPVDIAEQSEARRRLQACIDELVPQHGRAITEAFYTGASYGDLAQRANVPLGTMKSWIRRSLQLLKTCLQR